jgi:GNAT superfamily N-acetyltransferase
MQIIDIAFVSMLLSTICHTATECGPGHMIRILTEDDLSECFYDWAVNIVYGNVATFYGKEWCSEKKRKELKIPNMLFFVFYIGTDPAGFAAALPDVEPYSFARTRKVLYIYEIQVRKQMQSQGIGSALMSEICLYAVRHSIPWLLLTHYRNNSNAEKFYSKHGFDIDWSSPIDQSYVIMSKMLDAASSDLPLTS